MRFGTVSLGNASGSILAHSIHAGGSRYRKGLVLSDTDVEKLAAAGVSEVIVAELTDEDVGEDEAASKLADALLAGTSGLGRSAAFTGRANIYAEEPGLVVLDADAVTRLNSINPAITLATLANMSRVMPRSLVATVKIITYAVPRADLDKAIDAAGGIVSHVPVVRRDAGLVVTCVEGQKRRLAEKGKAAIASRLAQLGIELRTTRIVPHGADEIGAALGSSEGSLLLLLTGSATSDERDVGPEGLRKAGGTVRRFGMPVDPGNLLFLGELKDRPVIGLPGCARSPALNGADWVLERIACGIDLTDLQFAEMGVGGLLKEIPLRPQPRAGKSGEFARPRVAVLVLVQEPADRLADFLKAASRSHAELVRIVGPKELLGDTSRFTSAAEGCFIVTESGDRSDMLKAGVDSVSPTADAVLLLRSSGLVPTADLLNRLMAAFSPKDGREICRVASQSDGRGPPILFGSRFFESLAGLSGGRGAADLLREAQEFLCEVRP